MIPRHARLLRLYTNVNEHWKGAPLYRAVVETARGLGVAGASVFPVELGYGAHRRIHDAASDYSSFEIPIVVEIVDSTERLTPLLNVLETMVIEGIVVISHAEVVRYTHAVERDAMDMPQSDMGQRANPDRVAAGEGHRTVKLEGDAKRMTIYVGSADTWGGRNLAVAIVERCRELGLAGATVSRGVMGYGKHSVIHKAHFLGLSDDLPEKIEVIDRPEEIERLLPLLDPMIGGGLIVVDDVQIVRYLHDRGDAAAEAP